MQGSAAVSISHASCYSPHRSSSQDVVESPRSIRRLMLSLRISIRSCCSISLRASCSENWGKYASRYWYAAVANEVISAITATAYFAVALRLEENLSQKSLTDSMRSSRLKAKQDSMARH